MQKALPSIAPVASKSVLIFLSRSGALAFQEEFDTDPHEIPKADGRPPIRLRVGPPQEGGEKARVAFLQGLRRLEHRRPAGTHLIRTHPRTGFRRSILTLCEIGFDI